MDRVRFPDPARVAFALVVVAGVLVPTLATAAGMAVKSGTYLGNATNRSIFVGFQPDVVIIDMDQAATAAPDDAVIRTSSMAGDRAKSMDAATAPAADRIQSLDVAGFTLGTQATVNGAGITYHWVAFRAAPGTLKVGTYVGDGITDSRSITGVGFQPEYVIVMPNNTQRVVQRTSDMPPDLTHDFSGLAFLDGIQALEADGFQVGLDATVNAANITYYYAAWSVTPGEVATGVYTGDGVTDPLNIAGLGFAPEHVIVNRSPGAAGPAVSSSVHKMASTGVTVDRALIFDSRLRVANNIKALQANGFDVGLDPRVNSGVAPNTYYWVAFGPRAGTTNYRSIGSAAAYGTGTISVTGGSATVTGAGTSWLTANRGRGDVITIPCGDPPACTSPVPGVHYTVAAVSTNLGLQLTQAYAGATASGVSYLIRRQLSTLTAWEDCIDGLANGGSCDFFPGAGFPPASDSLVADNRSEVGIAYADAAGADFAGGLDIDGNVANNTDATHTITLTADGGNRHFGRAGQGVLIDNGSSLTNAIRVRDDFVTVEWMEIVGGGAGADGITLSGIAATSQVVLRNNLVHGVNADGLDIADDNSKVDVYDNIVYNNTGRGIRVSPGILQPGSRYRLLNNTVYNNVQEGFYKTPDVSAAATILLRNNISHTNGGDYALDPTDSLDSTSRDNLGGDATGGGVGAHSPAGGNLDSVPLASLRFVSTTPGSENLHIQEGSAAENNGTDLSSIFTTDIDAALRRTVWDRGADDVPAVVNYRSIGTLTYNFGTANIAVTGTTIVTGTGGTMWKANNRGRGDVITIPCPSLPGCAGGTHYTIQAVTSDNTLVLTTPFAGAPGSYTYAIRRQFATLLDWENCVDGGSLAVCTYFATASSSLVADDRSEVGIAYKDGVLGKLDIDGSTTDALHTITLTADPGNRHLGIENAGVVVDGGSAILANILVEDDHVTVEWLEVKGGHDEGVECQNLAPGSKGVLRYLLVHDTWKDGILVDDADASVDVYNNIVYTTNTHAADPGSGGIQIATALTTGTVRVFNNTVYGAAEVGIFAAPGSNPSITLVNNLAHSNTAGDYSVAGLNSSSRNNLSGTTGATGGVIHSPAGGGMESIALYNLSAPYGVNFVADNVNNLGFNLHLRSSSLAIDQGANLSAVFGTDIDNALRTGAWDIGADEQGATTEVTLEAFSALGLDSAVELSWKTASELRNLGFHLDRSTSASGPWTRITPSLIPGLGSSPIGKAYSFRDAGLTNGTRYWYRLEDVDASGLSTQHGPVSATPVVSRASDAPSPAGSADPSRLDPKAADGAVRPWGDPSVVDFRILRRTRNHLLVELETRGFYTSTDPSSGLLRVTIPTFEPASDPQGPALPLRRALLDAVVGRRARIASVRSLDLVSFPGLVPQAEGFSEMAVSADGTVRARRRAASLRAAQRELLPEEPAWLRASVFLGDEKKLVLELSPLRFDPRGRRLVLARRLRVLISFGEREPEERGAGVRGRKDPGHQDPISERLLAFIHVAREGLQAVSFEELFPGRPGAIPLRSLKLSRKGVAVPFHVAPRGASFGPGGLLVFHADASAPSTSFTGQIAYSLSLATNGTRMPEVEATPSASAAVTSWALSRFETNRHYQAGLLDAPEPWLWEALLAGAPKTIGFSLSGVEATSALAARLIVALQGASDVDGVVDHHLRAFVNGVFAGELRFDGKRPASLDVELAPSLLKEGQNELTLENTGEGRVASLVFLDRFSLAYPQAPIARGGQFEGTWAASGTAEIAGFAVPPLGVVEVAGTAVRWLSGVEWTGGQLRFRAEAGWRTLAAAAEAIPHPRVSFPAPPPWDETTQADYILITPEAFLETARRLVARRESQGLSTLSVSLETIAERFGHGEASAEAIRGFLAHAFHHFAPPSPRYVVLLGGSTYDPRNFFGRSRPSPLPPLVVKTSYLWTVSDPTLAAVNGDDALPDLAIGRLPASTVEEAGVLIDKQLAWEDSGQALDGRAVLVADNPDTAGDFEANQRDIQSSFLGGRESELLFLRELGSGTRPAILGAFDAGASLMSYVGHGGAAVWASENVLNSWDAASLVPQSRQPVLLTMNCLNGYFLAATFNSIAEAFLKAEGRGSVAGFSPSGLSLDGPAHLYHRAFVAELVSGRHGRLGDALVAAQKAYAETGAMPELLSIYHLLGDPAMTIR